MKNLIGKTAIVTGGAASIGGDITRALVAAGANVVVAARTAPKGEAIAAELGDNCTFVQTDITDDDALDELVEAAIKVYGGINILVNNACTYTDNGPATTREEWHMAFDVNIISAAILSEKARQHLAKNNGCIINIGSISGKIPRITQWAYPISKSALHFLTKSMAVDYAADGIRVNQVSLVSYQSTSCILCKKLGKLGLRHSGEMGNDDHLAQFKSQDSGLLPQLSEIIAVTFLHLANETVGSKAFEQARNLT